MPVIDKGLAPQLGRGQVLDLPRATPLRQLHALAVNAAWLPAPTTRSPRNVSEFELVRLFRQLSLTLDRPPGMDPYALRTPADILTLRLAELTARIADPGPVRLVSTPTGAKGWIDAAALVARIAEAESAGWQPWPLDFDQALLRLPESPDPATVHAAHRLVSPAGRRLAGWLRGGRPTLPESNLADLARIANASDASNAPSPIRSDVSEPSLAVDREHDTHARSRSRSPRVHPLLTLPDQPPHPALAAPEDLSAHPGPLAPSTLFHLLRHGWYPPHPMADGSCWTVCWPALLPNRPDLVSIAVVWHARHPDAHGGSCPSPVLSRAASGSRYGHSDGSLAAIARGITSRSPTKRADAAQALAVLAASGHLDAQSFAAALAAFATRTDRQFLRSAVPALRHALSASAHPIAANRTAATHPAETNRATGTRANAASGSAASAIGGAIVGWLPAILPPSVVQPLPYTSHLLNLAADALASARPAAPERSPRWRKPKPPPTTAGVLSATTIDAAIDALTRLVTRPARSHVSDAAQRLLTVITQTS